MTQETTDIQNLEGSVVVRQANLDDVHQQHDEAGQQEGNVKVKL